MRTNARIFSYLLACLLAVNGASGVVLSHATAKMQDNSCVEMTQHCCCMPEPAPTSNCCDEKPLDSSKTKSIEVEQCGCEWAPMSQPLPVEPASTQTISIETFQTHLASLPCKTASALSILDTNFSIPIHAPPAVSLQQCVRTVQLRI